MADIRELGESLLQRTRDRNRKNFERGRREAYKIALLQGGVNLFKNSLKNKANNFMNSEPAMAARVKQRQGVEDAQFFREQQDAIDASGMTAVGFYTKQMLPQAKILADEQVREEGLNTDQYAAYLRQEVTKLAEQRAQTQSAGFAAAREVVSPEDFAAFQALSVQRSTSTSNWVTSTIGKIFGGKNQQELDRLTIDAISNSDMVQKSATVSAIKAIYGQTGNLDLAIRAGEAVADGRIPKRAVVSNLVPIGGVNSTTTPDGGVQNFVVYHAKDENGNVIVKDGKPVTVTVPVGFNLTPTNPDLIDDMERLNDSQRELQSASLNQIFQIQDEDTQKMFDDYTKALGSSDEANPALMINRLAATSVGFARDFTLDELEAQNLTSMIFMNRMTDSAGEKTGIPFFRSRDIDFSSVDINAEPDSLDVIRGIGELEVTPYAIDFSMEQLGTMLGTMVSDFSGRSTEDQTAFIEELVKEQATKYPFMFVENSLGESPFKILTGDSGEGNEQAIENQQVTPVVAPIPRINTGVTAESIPRSAQETLSTLRGF